MAAFEYTALDQLGNQQKGVFEADSSRQVRQMLRDKQWTPLTILPLSEKSSTGEHQQSRWQRGISVMEQAALTRQLATLIQAAIPIEESLRAVAEQQEKKRIKNMLLAIRSRVLEGYTFANSLDVYPKIFPNMYRATVAAGEHAGHLDQVLNRLADYSEDRMKSSQKIQQAMIYPIILMVAALGIVSFLLGFVVPDVIKVFVDSGQELPTITVLLIAASEGFQTWWPLLFSGLAAVIFFTKRLLKQPAIQLQWHQKLLKAPLVGKLIKAAESARFASTLHILTRSGVSLVDALIIAEKVIHNRAISAAVQDAAKRVSEGESLNRALSATHYFPPLMLHMIASGESTGDLDAMLERIAENQQTELDSKVSIILGLFEPLMLVVMGGIVMVVVLAILLPILNMNQLLS